MEVSRRRGIGLSAFALVLAVGAAAAAGASDPPTVLFMCPHGAAKSVLASAYFERAAKERGLEVRVVSAGTDPDADVSPVVASHLNKNGYRVPVTKPRRATAADMAAADVVISIGCDLSGLRQPRGTLVKWDDVPALSDGFAAADAKIRDRVIQLIDELARDGGIRAPSRRAKRVGWRPETPGRPKNRTK